MAPARTLSTGPSADGPPSSAAYSTDPARQSTLRLDRVSDLLPDLFFLLDGNGVIVDYKASAVEDLYLPPAIFLGRPVADVLPPAVAERLQEAAVRARGSREIQVVDYALLMAGREQFFEARLVPFDDDQTVALIRDIDQRTRIEAALRESERRLRDMLETVDLVAVSIDAEGRVQFCNDALLDLTGWRRDQVLGQDWFELFIPAQVRGRIRPMFDEAIATGFIPAHYENDIVTRDGRERLIRWSNTILRDMHGAVAGTSSIGEDSTLRKQAEEALLLKDKAIAASINGIVFADPQGYITYANASFATLVGCADPEEVVGAHLSAFAADSGAVQETLQSLLEGGSWVGQIRALRRDGSTCDVQISGSAFTDDSGEVIHVMASCLDVTERARMEDQLRETNVKLAASVQLLERQRHEILRLNEMSDSLHLCRSTAEAYSVVARSLAHAFPALSGFIAAPQNRQRRMDVREQWGTVPVPTSIDPSECRAVREGRPYRGDSADHASICPHLAHAAPRIQLCLPLIGQNRVLGLIHMAQTDPDVPVSVSTMEMAQTAAESAALALTNIELRESLKQQAIRDPLTGLFNRRYAEEVLSREVAQAVRHETQVGLLLIDLDQFKAFNDTHGHEAGDQVLRELGRYMRAHIRHGDVACRYGGEEFLIIMPHSPLEAACARAEDLRCQIKGLELSYQERMLGQITLSVGVAHCPEHDRSPRRLLRLADDALYRAKAQGRDRIAVAQVQEPSCA